MPVFPFIPVVEDMLQNEALMNRDNLIQDNFDHRTWTPITPVKEFIPRFTTVPTKQEEASTELELLVDAPPCPTTISELISKRIAMLFHYQLLVDPDGTYHWAPGTITSVNQIRMRDADVEIQWDANRNLSQNRTKSSWTLKFNDWCVEKEGGWRYHREDHILTTKKSVKPAEDTVQDILIDDLYSGTMMTQAVDRFVGDLLPPGIQAVRALPIVFFIDKSHTDLHGSLATTPASITFGVFNIASHRRVQFWRNSAYIPPLNVGRGTNAGSLDC